MVKDQTFQKLKENPTFQALQAAKVAAAKEQATGWKRIGSFFYQYDESGYTGHKKRVKNER